jgi:hypothetical protein
MAAPKFIKRRENDTGRKLKWASIPVHRPFRLSVVNPIATYSADGQGVRVALASPVASRGEGLAQLSSAPTLDSPSPGATIAKLCCNLEKEAYLILLGGRRGDGGAT